MIWDDNAFKSADIIGFLGFPGTAWEVWIVDRKGLEPSTFALRTRRSPS
jgi:hypothetical protein